jgi:hypothetical protein
MKKTIKEAMIVGSIILLVLISGCVSMGSGSKDVKEQYGRCSVIAMRTSTYEEKYVKDNMGAERLESFKQDPASANSITYYFDGEDIHWIPFPDIEKD